MTRVPVRYARGILALAAIGLLATCQHETVGPGRRAALAVAPVLPSATRLAAFNLTIDGARLIVVSPPADTALDRTYPFPANQTSLQIEADISLDQSPQTFAVTIQLLSGSTVLFAGTQNVTLSSGSSTPSTQIPVIYTGPGQTVASLTIDPQDSVLSFGGAMTFRATALDGQGAPVPNFYVSWTTSDTVAAPIDATGHLVAPSVRRRLTVTAQTPNNVVASTAITFAPVATTLAVLSGCGQSGLLGTQLPQPIVAKVTAGDGLGVRGVMVTFTPPAGAAVATPQVATDSTGVAQTFVTLGSSSGPAAFQVSAPGLTTVPCNQSAFGAATQLVFLTQPSSTFAGNVIAPPVVVEARDAQGTPVPTFTGDVSVALGNNPGGATLTGTTTVAAVGGQASFDDLSLDKVGAGYTLAFTATGLATATSAPFAISGGSPDHLVFTVPPVNTPSGTAITPAVVIGAQDALGNPASLTGDVTISINTGPAGAALTGTTTVTAAAGVATFGNLMLDKTGTYTLRAQATGLGAVNSAPFDVTTGLSRQAVFTTGPSDVVAGAAIAPAVVVEVQDLQGNTDVTFNGNVGIVIRINAGGGTLSGTDTVTAASGVATFSDLSIDKSGVGYTLEAGASGVAAGVSNSFTVNPGAASQLAFVVPPTTVGVGAPIAPVVVGVEDAFGNLVTNATDQIDLRIGVNPPGNAVLGGSTTINATNGLATFSDLTIDLPGTGFTLVAGSGTLTSATSPPFDVLAGATQLLVQVTPTTQTAGQPVDIQVTAQDGLGNTVTSYRGTILFSTSDAQGSVPAPYTFTAGDNGSHLFAAGATLGSAGTQLVSATDQANSSITGFGTVTINPGAAALLGYSLQPTTVVQNQSMSVGVAVEDAFHNVVPTATQAVTLAIQTNPGGGTLTGGGPVGAVSGIASFTVSIDQPGNGYTLVAMASGLTSATSTPFDVLGGATKTWTGEVGTDWSTDINWLPSGVPTSSDDVLIPSGQSNYPTLSANSAVHNLTMQSGASLETAGFVLDVFGNLDAPFTPITGTGTVLLDGSGTTVQGSLPNVQVGGTVTVIGLLIVEGDLDIVGGALDLGKSQSIVVNGAVTTSSTGVLVDTAGSVLTVYRDAIFGGGSEAGLLTSGTFQLLGHFTQNGDPESFAADSAFFTILFGDSTQQLVTFTNPGSGAGASHFGGLQAYDTAGVSLASAVFVNGPFYSAPINTVPALFLGNGHAMTVQGFTLDSVVIDNMPLVVTNSPQGLFGQDVTFQNFSQADIQLDITRNTGPGVTFTNFKFLGAPPTTGWHLFVHDPVIGNGAFSVTMVTPSPLQSGGARFTTSGEATISWP
jgi:hypothetical protein